MITSSNSVMAVLANTGSKEKPILKLYFCWYNIFLKEKAVLVHVSKAIDAKERSNDVTIYLLPSVIYHLSFWCFLGLFTDINQVCQFAPLYTTNGIVGRGQIKMKTFTNYLLIDTFFCQVFNILVMNWFSRHHW